MALILLTIGGFPCYQGDYEDALKHFREAFELAFHSNPPDKIYAAHILHNEGRVYERLGNYKKSLEYHQRALTILHEHEGNIEFLLPNFYDSIGGIYRLEEDLDKAHDYFSKALDIRKRISPNHHHLAFSYGHIVQMYSNQKDYKKALEYYSKGLKIRENVLTSDHYNVASSQHWVGKMYYAMDDLENARYFYFKALEIDKTYQNTSLYTNVTLIHVDIARTYRYNTQESLDHRLEAWNTLQSSISNNFPNLIRFLDDIAFTYHLVGNTEQALSFYKGALKIREEISIEKVLSLSHTCNKL